MSASLPDFLFNAWQFRKDHISEAKARGELRDWNVSSLCSAYLKYQLDRHERELRANVPVSPPSFIWLLVGHILDQLRLSTNLEGDVNAVAATLELGTLQHILQDPRTPYATLRLFDALPSATIAGSGGDRKIMDIDEAVLASEQYVRSRHQEFSDRYLVTLEDLATIFGPPDGDGFITLKRKSPPKGGFEFLDHKKRPVVRAQGSDAAFVATFDRVTKGILKGLDWDHVFIQGGMVLHTLLHTDPSKDSEGDIAECDIDMYLYDLEPDEANCKVEEIYKIYSANSATYTEHVVIKNAQTINFIPQYPHRRVQIVLKLLHSPLESLLRVDLDACAVGFDGSRVFMLPRCARAIETGYSVFTMDLIWGHRLGNRRETQLFRIFKYARRGFGLRILPSYCQSLGNNKFEAMALPDTKTSLANKTETRSEPTRVFENEPGLKTLRRIVYLAQTFVHRCCFGPSKFIDSGTRSSIPFIQLYDMGGPSTNAESPGGRNSIGIFELFMRHCEAWRLHAMGLVDFHESQSETFAYDRLDVYDGLPSYTWSAHTTENMEHFKSNATSHNGDLFWALRRAIAQKLNIDPHQGRYVGYLTRRIRRLIADGNLRGVQAKQITMPLIIPMTLQAYITDELGYQYDDLPDDALSLLLIPAHDPSKYDPATATLPSLRDTVNESGNIRYWLITNRSMWAGRHRLLDEVAELLLALFTWLARTGVVLHRNEPTNLGTDNPECLWHLAQIFRRRLVLPETSNTLERGQVLPEREARLFRAWALSSPPGPESYRSWDDNELHNSQDELTEEGDVADELFWKDGDQGTWDNEEGVPVWRD